MIAKDLFLLVVLLMPFFIEAKKYRSDDSDSSSELESDFRKYDYVPRYKHESRKHHLKHKPKYEKFNKEDHFAAIPPDHTKIIAMARFVVHQADWTSVATLSTIPSLRGFPFTNIVSMSDGPVDNSTGIPYFYLTPLDFTSKDLQKDNRCTISVTLEETDYCNQQNIDPEDPRCARVMLSGKMKTVRNNTSEYDFAKKALFTRHPSMATLPADHHFYFAKLKISQIAMLDWFGGPKFIGVRQYLDFKPEKKAESLDLIDDNNIYDEFNVVFV